MTEFQLNYKGPVSIGKRMSHIREELESAFDFSSYIGKHNVRYYTFKKLYIEKEVEDEIQAGTRQYLIQEIEGEQLFLFEEEGKELLVLEKAEEIANQLQPIRREQREMMERISEIKWRAYLTKRRQSLSR